MSKQWEHPVGVANGKLAFGIAYVCIRYAQREPTYKEVMDTMRELGAEIDRATAFRWLASIKEAKIRAGIEKVA